MIKPVITWCVMLMCRPPSGEVCEWGVCLFVVCLSATCEYISGTDLHNFTCCHSEIEVADPTFYLTQSQYTDTGPTSPSADHITPGAWQGSH